MNDRQDLERAEDASLKGDGVSPISMQIRDGFQYQPPQTIRQNFSRERVRFRRFRARLCFFVADHIGVTKQALQEKE